MSPLESVGLRRFECNNLSARTPADADVYGLHQRSAGRLRRALRRRARLSFASGPASGLAEELRRAARAHGLDPGPAPRTDLPLTTATRDAGSRRHPQLQHAFTSGAEDHETAALKSVREESV